MIEQNPNVSSASVVNTPESRVLCVDLDGTLISTDLLWESFVAAVRRRPWVLLLAPCWLSRGRAYLKRRLAEVAEIDFATLPYHASTLEFVMGEYRSGRRIVLATASDHRLAHGVADHLGCFADVLASDGKVNLKGRRKADALVERFGAKNFDYIGDSRSDIACWATAEAAWTVGIDPKARVGHLRRLPGTDAGGERSPWWPLATALRPHQWLKNLLLAVPALASHQLDTGTLTQLLVAFVSLSLCASGGYVLNDLLDLAADRRHHRKRHRPFASGRLSPATGVLLIGALWAAGFGIAAALLPPAFVAVAALYLVGTAAYSIRLKKEPVLDVMFLAGLYVIRVIAGGAAIGVQPSSWLLAFTLFVCVSLAFLKRYIEAVSDAAIQSAELRGRGYLPTDGHWLQSAGLASAYLSVVILTIYISSDDVKLLYSHPERLLLVCPVLLYWATKIWLDAHRRRMHDDPLVAVASDSASYVLLLIAGTIVLAAV